MATASAAAGTGGAGPFDDSPPRSTNVKWATGFLVAAVAVFVFYQYIYPDLNQGAQTFFRDWLSPTAVNEALIFVIMALGLNIVVGYAGLLDLGYVAFWAIGGYTGGWLMSAFIYKVKVKVGGSALPTAAGRPHQLLGRPDHRRAVLRPDGHHHRCADAAAEERLPRHRDPGLRRDHPPVLHQRQQHLRSQPHQRCPGHPAGRQHRHRAVPGSARGARLARPLRRALPVRHLLRCSRRSASSCHCASAPVAWAGRGWRSARTSWPRA